MTGAWQIAAALPAFAAFLAFFCRTSAFLHTAPFVSDHALPSQARVAAAALFALGMAAAAPDVTLDGLPLLLPAELALGAAAGFMVRLAVAGLEAGGELIGMHLGLGFAQTVDPSSGGTTLPTRQLAWVAGGIAFLASDGLGAVLRLLAAPAPGAASPRGLIEGVLAHGGDVLIAAVRLAAPVLVATLVANLAFALASRAAPAMNIFSIAFGAVLLIGGLALLGTVPRFGLELQGTMARVNDLVTDVVSR